MCLFFVFVSDICASSYSGCEIGTWKRFAAVFLIAKRVSHSTKRPGLEHSPWKILQTWIFSTLGYCLSGSWKRLISKIVIVRTNDNNKLLLLYLIFERVRGRLRVLFTWYVNYSTVPNCRGNELYVREDVCAPVFEMERSNQNDIVELWTFSLKLGWLSGVVVRTFSLKLGWLLISWRWGSGWRINSFFALSVILRTLVYPIICCLLVIKFLEFLFFYVSLYDVPCASFYVLRVSNFVLTVPVSIPVEKKKIKLNFYFHTFLGYHKTNLRLWKISLLVDYPVTHSSWAFSWVFSRY